MSFGSYHPALNLLFFVSVIACAAAFDHPAFLVIGYVSAFAYSVKLNGLRALVFNAALIPLGAAFVCYYTSYTHFGITVLGHNAIGNSITLESIVTGAVVALRVAMVLMWMSCVFAIFTADKVVYLLGRVSPRLSLLLAIALRMVPRIKRQASRVNTAQGGIGCATWQGGLLRRLRNALRVGSSTLTWTLESFAESSDSMRSRGSLLRGRTAYSLYRFDGRDRAFVLFLVTCGALVVAGVLLDQTHIHYNPEIVMNRVTALSFVFYVAYACLCLSPLVLELVGEASFAHDKALAFAHGTGDEGVARLMGAVSEKSVKATPAASVVEHTLCGCASEGVSAHAS